MTFEVLKTTTRKAALLRDLARQKHPHQALGDIAARHGLTFDQAFDIVSAHGYPDPTAMRKAADTLEAAHEPAQPKPAAADPVEQLLRKAEKSTKQRTRKMAEKARILLAELNQAVQAEERETQARKAADEERSRLKSEVDKLEQQLAEKKAALRGKPTTAAKPTTSDNQTIRAWAAAAGIDCPARGRIPASVRGQYDAATLVPSDAAGAA